MSDQPTTSASPKRPVILDTNIILYAISDELSVFMSKILDTGLKNDYEFYLSDFSRFELLKGLSLSKTDIGKEAKIATFLNSDISALPVTRDVLEFAAELFNQYQSHLATKPYMKRYSPGDLIIGATAAVNQAMILTADMNDYPAPFFHEVSRNSELYEEASSIAPKLMTVGLFDVDYAILERYPQDKKRVVRRLERDAGRTARQS